MLVKDGAAMQRCRGAVDEVQSKVERYRIQRSRGAAEMKRCRC